MSYLKFEKSPRTCWFTQRLRKKRKKVFFIGLSILQLPMLRIFVKNVLSISPLVIHSQSRQEKRTIWKHLRCFVIFQHRVWKKNLQLPTLAVGFTESPHYRSPESQLQMETKMGTLSCLRDCGGWIQNKRPKFQLVPNHGEFYSHKAPICQCNSEVIGALITLFAHINKGGVPARNQKSTRKTLAPSNETTCFCQQLNWLESCLFLLVLVHMYFHWSLMSIELKA